MNTVILQTLPVNRYVSYKRNYTECRNMLSATLQVLASLSVPSAHGKGGLEALRPLKIFFRYYTTAVAELFYRAFSPYTTLASD